MSEKTIFNFQVKGELPRDAVAALFSNFLAVAQVGTEVQFEFVFLDLSLLAGIIEKMKAAGVAVAPAPITVDGKSVAKVIMPAAVFVQMKEHFDKIFNALAQEGITPKLPEDKGKDERHSTSNVG